MKRGDISNKGMPELWVCADAVFVKNSDPPWRRWLTRTRAWSRADIAYADLWWRLANTAQLVLVIVDGEGPSRLKSCSPFQRVEYVASWQELHEKIRTSSRIIEAVTTNPAHLRDNKIILFPVDPRRYGGR